MANDILRDVIPNSTQESKITEKKRRKKIPGIYMRGNRWQIDTFYRNQRLQESFATIEAAESNLFKMKSLVDEGRFMDKKRKPKDTLGEFAARYLDWCESMKEKAYTKKKARLNAAVEWIGKDILLGDVTREIIEKYQAERLTQPGLKKKVAGKATVNRDVSVIRHMLQKGVEWSILSDNPLRGMKKFKETGRRLRYLTPEECQTLISACSPNMKNIVTLALHTGMRKSELLNLTWDSVNLREKYIELIDQKNGERSSIPLTSTALKTLRSIPPRVDSKYVFTGKTPNTPFYDLKRQFEKAVIDSKLERVTFHVLRHSCASHLVMAGVDLVTVKEILRHKSIEMTMRYSHLSPEHKKSAVQALEMALTPKAENSAKEA
jgi:integrase